MIKISESNHFRSELSEQAKPGQNQAASLSAPLLPPRGVVLFSTFPTIIFFLQGDGSPCPPPYSLDSMFSLFSASLCVRALRFLVFFSIFALLRICVRLVVSCDSSAGLPCLLPRQTGAARACPPLAAPRQRCGPFGPASFSARFGLKRSAQQLVAVPAWTPARDLFVCFAAVRHCWIWFERARLPSQTTVAAAFGWIL